MGGMAADKGEWAVERLFVTAEASGKRDAANLLAEMMFEW
jgi:hypothetical protein